MKLRRNQWIQVVVALAVVLAVAACAKKKAAPLPAAPPPPPPAPTAMLTANPNTITAGQASTLTWTTDFASDVTIDTIGKVDPSGSMKVTPTESTTYRLVAKNDTGTKEATARITVTPAPPPPPTTSSTCNESDARLFSQNVKDVFFEYDSYDITSQDQSVIQADARFLQQHPNMTFHDRGPLRRARLDRVQPGARRESRQGRQTGAGAGGSCRRPACAPSATARKSRSAPKARNRAGSRTAAPTSCTRSNAKLSMIHGAALVRPAPLPRLEQDSLVAAIPDAILHPVDLRDLR